ncbi:hypothetical protein [uncultured Akkermansia sp.]|uniref:hypothetical protein n=1 Tax=uncultured Akkermansia sp. TaxID=512294 RepID=UPI00259690D5|nr:hypothetical protein [uncultured Akkermansia sp.]
MNFSLFSHDIFPNRENFFIFSKNISETFGKEPLSSENFSVYVKNKWGEIVNWGIAFDLEVVPYRLPCPVWLKIVYRCKNEKGGTIADSTLW